MSNARLVAVAAIVLGTMALAKPLTTLKSGTMTVTSTAAAVPSATGCALHLLNTSTTPVYIGGSNVTTSNGFPICSDTTACPRWDYPADAASGVVFAVKAGGGSVTLRYNAAGGC